MSILYNDYRQKIGYIYSVPFMQKIGRKYFMNVGYKHEIKDDEYYFAFNSIFKIINVRQLQHMKYEIEFNKINESFNEYIYETEKNVHLYLYHVENIYLIYSNRNNIAKLRESLINYADARLPNTSLADHLEQYQY